MMFSSQLNGKSLKKKHVPNISKPGISFYPVDSPSFLRFPAEFQEGAHGLIQGRSQDAGGFVAGVAGQVLETFGGTFSSEIEDWGIHHEI